MAASFQALGASVMPIIIQEIIAICGWPLAIMALAACEIVVCLPLVSLLVKDDPQQYKLYPDGDEADHAALVEAGPSVWQIVRTSAFWKLAVAFAIMDMSFYALATNVAFIMTKSAGLSLAQVSIVQAIAGSAVLFGRIGFGYLLDRFSAQVVGILASILSATFFTGYAIGASFGFMIFAAAIGGASVDGESDLMPYFAVRYFGKQAVSKIFGWFLCAYVLGAAFGPVAFAVASERFGGPSIRYLRWPLYRAFR